jgi:hypothetical protein
MIEPVIALSIGLGLAAACGFRVFVPLLVAGLATKAGLLTLADGFEWIGSWLAISAFAVATVVEIGAYYAPWLDNALDSIATPVAVIAGVILSAAFVHDMHPLLKWSLAIIAGGGVAGSIKAGLAALRLGSTTLTAGGGNLLVATFEWITAVVMAILSIFLPVLAAVAGLVLATLLLRLACRLVGNLRRQKTGSA